MTARSTSRLGSGAPSTGTITMTETTDVVTFAPGGPYSGLTVICLDNSPSPISFVVSSNAVIPVVGLVGTQAVAVGQVLSLSAKDGIAETGPLYVKIGGAIGSRYQIVRSHTALAKSPAVIGASGGASVASTDEGLHHLHNLLLTIFGQMQDPGGRMRSVLDTASSLNAVTTGFRLAIIS